MARQECYACVTIVNHDASLTWSLVPANISEVVTEVDNDIEPCEKGTFYRCYQICRFLNKLLVMRLIST